jgi:hypothetical protein
MNILKTTIPGILFVVFSFALVNSVQAANISFTEDTELALTGLATTLYALSGSEADTLTVDGSTLTVDIPAGSSFTLGAGSPTHNVLRITPAGGTTTLTFQASHLTSGGYATQWTLDSSTATSWDIVVGVSQPASYNIQVDSNHYTVLNTSGGEVSFTYTGNFSNKTFSIDQHESAGSTPTGFTPQARGQFLQEQQDLRQDSQDIEALKARIRELQLIVIDLAQQLIEALQERLRAASNI